MAERPEHFRQANPHDQQIVVVMAIEGHLDNLKESLLSGMGVAGIEQKQTNIRTIDHALRLLNDLRSLTQFQPRHWGSDSDSSLNHGGNNETKRS